MVCRVRDVAVVVVLGVAGCLSKPAPPGDELDEDGDGTPNNRDRCPHLAAADADRDSDDDGIGDGCDPEPSLENTRVFFEGFDAVVCGSEHLPYCGGGTIDTVNGWYGFGALTEAAILFARDFDRVAVTIGADSIARNGLAAYTEAGIVLCGVPMGAQGDFIDSVQAHFGAMADNMYVEVYERIDGGGTVQAHEPVPSLDLDVPVAGLELTCELRLPEVMCVLRNQGQSTTFSANDLERGPGQIGIFGNNLETRIRYVDVVALKPP